MKHFRDLAPDAALPNYSGVYLTSEIDSFVFTHEGIDIDVMLTIDCVGTDSGQFDPVKPEMFVQTPNMARPVKWPLIFSHAARQEHAPPLAPIVVSLCEALEKRWDRDVEAVLVEKAEEER